MIQLIPRHRYFAPHWAMTLLAILAMALFVRLGFWQIERAGEKKQMITALNNSSKQAPSSWFPGDALPAQYQLLKLQGHFLPQVLLLDNQHHQHQFGYDVLSPFVLADGHVVLVDRGWIAADVSRRLFPVIDTLSDSIQQTLSGRAYYPSEKTWLLGQALEKKNEHLVVVELLDAPLISQFLHKSVYPFIIRLGKEQPNGYLREWAVVAMSPDRHYGYALQWFAMALVILILYVSLNFNRKIPKKSI